jgi:cobalt/nickel transport system permease protein
MLAMHMANELLTPSVAGLFVAVAAAALAVASWRTRRLQPSAVPLMGVLGAFVFAAQMINFTLPLMPGTSGHLGGGLLLAILLGPDAAVLVMASILMIQCLIFQDGGLLALGANIINMALLPCYLGYAAYYLLFRTLRGSPAVRLYVAAFVAAVLAVTMGAAAVPLEAALAGVVTVPLRFFLATMIGVHLIIGAVEGLITFAVVAYLYQVRPDALPSLGPDLPARRPRLPWPVVIASFAVVALLLAGLVSHVASAYPDGLEWTYAHRPHQPDFQRFVHTPDPASLAARLDAWQMDHALLPDYGGRDARLLTVAGLAGTALTLVVTYLLARILRRRRSTPPTA